MRAGRLDKRIQIQRRLGDDWLNLAGSRWASVAPVRGDEQFDNPQLQAWQLTEFRLRWSAEIADLSPVDRIVYLAGSSATRDRYDIESVSMIGPQHEFRILARRRYA